MNGPGPRFGETAVLVRAVNEERARVVRQLTAYLRLAARMREFEDTFSAQVLYAAQQLHELIGERRRLQAECDRIRRGMDTGAYGSADEVAEDVRDVLTRGEGGADHAGHDAAPEPDGMPEEFDDELDENTRRRILRDFKRVVLPAVHTDTSDAPFSSFEAAYAAYKARDYAVMEAFVIRYRGEITPDVGQGRGVAWKEAAALLEEYRAAAERLEKRLKAMARELTLDEKDEPERTRLRMKRRSEQIRQAIDEEAERVLELRRRLEALAGTAYERHEHSYGTERS